MNMHTDKIQENKNQPRVNKVAQKQVDSESTFQFVDNRPDTVAQRKLQETANNSPQAKQTFQLQAMADDYSAQQEFAIQQKKENNTGMPDSLKSGIENLSGYSMDDVKVHYNSDKPGQLQAHAYAQGTDIHIASGQEKHLPHEAWHVVQQKQGRVQPTFQMKGKVNINDDAGLEKEADVMGEKALQLKAYQEMANNSFQVKQVTQLHSIEGGHFAQQQIIQNKNNEISIIQLSPQKKIDSEEYFDPDFAKLILIKLRYDKFQIKGTETILYFEPGEGYYTDESLTTKADMSGYVGEREGVSNANGQMYYCRDDQRDGIITIETASNILDRFFEEAPQHREIHDFKVNRVLEGFKSEIPLPPITIEPRNGKASLVDGRHRIIASIKNGFKYIPYSSNTY